MRLLPIGPMSTCRQRRVFRFGQLPPCSEQGVYIVQLQVPGQFTRKNSPAERLLLSITDGPRQLQCLSRIFSLPVRAA